ncbi:MAG TPA: PBP1A family penicillin-binding protein [Longimicrobiales bacterium]|nr:PBP1A family penicillin-binding protein [Longimicrobiales bacterium]
MADEPGADTGPARNADPAGTPAGAATRRRWRPQRRQVVLMAALGFVFLLWLLWQRCGLSGCPNVEGLAAYQPGGASALLDRNGDEFATLSPIEHDVVELEDLPEYVPAAFVSVEDKRFYEHHGVDSRRVLGALLANVRARGVSQGFSTITMQLARNVWPERLPGQQRTLTRKILEIRVAREIERHFAKDEILQLYLNNIYFGSGAYGIEAAARNYWRKPARSLTLDEAALLAAMPKSPTAYNPRRFRARAEERRDLVLALMADQRAAPLDDIAAARERPVRVRRDPPASRNEVPVAPYFVESVRRVLEDRFGEDIYTSPLRIHTTLDRRAQRSAEEQLRRQLRNIENGLYGRFRGPRYQADAEIGEETEYLQGAVVLLSAESGAVRALVGGRDYAQSRFNRGTRARRQAGSAFKPFVYAAALAEGYPPSQLISDSTLRMELPGGEIWEPRNITGEYEGAVSMRAALVRSKNVPTIRLAQDVGINDVRRLAERAGVHSEIPDLPSMAIGSGGVTPLELTAAYTAFAALGSAVAPRFVTRVENGAGKVIWRNRAKPRKVLDREVAYLVTDMLRDAIDEGTGTAVRRAGYGGVAAGKTGTTNDGADVWFVGYTPEYVATIWMGFDRPDEIVDDASGGRLAAPVWARLMSDVHGRRRGADWERPDKVIERRIDPETGYTLIEGCRPRRGSARNELFIDGTEPPFTCPEGRPEPGARDVFDRFEEWLGGLWYRASRWLARHVGTEEPREPEPEERFLGVPRLPRAIDVPEIEEPLGVPVPELDTMTVPAPLPPDTLPADTAVEPLPVDTTLPSPPPPAPRDSLPEPPRDTLPERPQRRAGGD